MSEVPLYSIKSQHRLPYLVVGDEGYIRVTRRYGHAAM